MKKATCAAEAHKLEEIPNIGPSLAGDLRGLGILTPRDVRRMQPLQAYELLRTPMGRRHDPCVLDVFLAAHAFMNGAEARPWWAYTAQRKALLAQHGAVPKPRRAAR